MRKPLGGEGQGRCPDQQALCNTIQPGKALKLSRAWAGAVEESCREIKSNCGWGVYKMQAAEINNPGSQQGGVPR